MRAKILRFIRSAETQLTVYGDTDILWFRDPSELLIDYDSTKSFWLKTQQDRQIAYDVILLELWPFLRRPPFHCTGVVVMKGNPIDYIPNLGSALVIAHETGGSHFTEQTMIAAANVCSGMGTLSATQAYIDWDDRFQLGPTFLNRPWVLRHYVGPVRHLFWRDVFFLPLKKCKAK